MARPGLSRHRKFLRLARALGSRLVARGALEFIWDKAYEDGDAYLGDSSDVAAAAEWDGEAGQLTQALLAAGGDDGPGFIEEVPDRAGHFVVHDLWHHAPDYVRRRRQREAERRQKSDPAGQCPVSDQSVTGQRTSSPDCQNGLDVTLAQAQALAPAQKDQSQNPLSDVKGTSDVGHGENGSGSPVSKKANPSHEADKLAALLQSCILRSKPDFHISPAQLRKWVLTADRMLRLDGRKYESVAAVIQWAQHDEFWMANILSMDAVRAKFDQLDLKRKRSNGKAKHSTEPSANFDDWKAEAAEVQP